MYLRGKIYKAMDRKEIFDMNYDVGRSTNIHKQTMSRWKVRGF